MANVCVNPNLDIPVPGTGAPTDNQNIVPLGWTRTTWEPVLCLGGGDTAASALDEQSFAWTTAHGTVYDVLGMGRIDPSIGYPGVLYSGPGFDANPGDSWSISFIYQWINADSGPFHFANQGDRVLTSKNNHALFVRYGITLFDEATGQWNAWYASLPLQDVQLPTNPSSADGLPSVYAYSFSVPANFPSGRYQFAICHQPNPRTQADYEHAPQTVIPPIGWAYFMAVNTVDLEQTSVGTPNSPGSSPSPSFWGAYPQPSFYPGYPSGFDVQVEWNQLHVNPPFSDQVTTTQFPHHGTEWFPFTPGFFAVELAVHKPADPDDFWESGGTFTSGIFPPLTASPVPLPPTDSLFPGGIAVPLGGECGPHRTFIWGIRYMFVGWQEDNLSNGFFNNYTMYQGDLAFVVHPALRPNTADTLAEADDTAPFLYSKIPVGLNSIPNEFDWNLPCAGQGIHIWDLPPGHR